MQGNFFKEGENLMAYCMNCKQTVQVKRKIGFGTVVLVLLTGFFWLLAIPFYRKRCIICGETFWKNKKFVQDCSSSIRKMDENKQYMYNKNKGENKCF